MKSEKVTPKLKEVYDKVETLRKSNPNMSTIDLAKKAGAHLSYYYKAKKMIEGAVKSYKTRGPYKKKDGPTLFEQEQLALKGAGKQTPLIALIGTPAEVMNALSSFVG